MAARVRIEPAGFELTVRSGQTVFDAALEAGVSWPTICFGQARCTACALQVISGAENADPSGQEEQAVLKQLAGRRRKSSMRDTRLACRLTVSNDLTVDKRGAKFKPESETQSE